MEQILTISVKNANSNLPQSSVSVAINIYVNYAAAKFTIKEREHSMLLSQFIHKANSK
jgi:hypothetical protein